MPIVTRMSLFSHFRKPISLKLYQIYLFIPSIDTNGALILKHSCNLRNNLKILILEFKLRYLDWKIELLYFIAFDKWNAVTPTCLHLPRSVQFQNKLDREYIFKCASTVMNHKLRYSEVKYGRSNFTDFLSHSIWTIRMFCIRAWVTIAIRKIENVCATAMKTYWKNVIFYGFHTDNILSLR